MKMSKPSHRLFVKSIVLLNVLIWQLGFHLECESASATDRVLPEGEVSALTTIVDQFKSKTTAPSISPSFCDYTASNYGFSITCDKCTDDGGTKCHIIGILFSNMGLTGTIDDAVGDLPHLRSIILSNNELQGSIPSSMGNLAQLTNLDLSNNKLQGAIPDSLGNLKKLRTLFLQNNFLDGMIPSSLGNLVSLRTLNLDFNMLWGPIPDRLGNLGNLIQLQMAENKLSGPLPATLGNLKFLELFYLPSNDLVGTLPASYAKLTNLRSFVVAGNDLSGPLPQFVTEWPNVQYLTLQGNNFEGRIPEKYFTLSKLQYLVITDLNTSSPFPLPPSANFPNMYRLVLRNCSINGSIPSYISELSGLKYLDLSFNNLTGEVSDAWKSSLIYVSLASNNLTGSIPRWIFQATRTRMDLSYNNFSAIEVPAPKNPDLNLFACCGCQNSSSPNIKPFMLKPGKMVETYLPGKNDRKFHSIYINSGGEETIFDGDRYDADNETSRSYVSRKRNWAYSSSGDFFVATVNSSDYTKRVPCKIPASDASIYADARLSPVSLHYYGLGLRKGKYEVTLYFAEIVYTEDIATYNLQRKRTFDIYIQDKREITDFDIREQAEGPNAPINITFYHVAVSQSLLHIHFYWTGRGSYANAPAFNGPLISAISIKPEFRVSGLSPMQIAFISVGSILFALLLLLFAWRMGWLENKELKDPVNVGKNQTVTLKELINATGNFSKDNKIGSGSLGTVYKAEPKDGKYKVAVKRLSSHMYNKENIKEIQTQIYNMKTTEDDNLIKLWDIHIGKIERLIVYEFMEDKSLEDALFGPNKRKLPWDTRKSICRGIANGLKQLHESQRSIVHGNLKPSNILLHGIDGVKLSDFGLVSVYREDALLQLAAKEASKCLHPVEYFNGNISTKSDVYSFGIILLVIVSGSRTEGMRTSTEETEFLLGTAYELNKKGRLNELVDKRLYGNYTEKEAMNILKLALVCTHAGPVERPTISKALDFLDGKIPLSEITPRDATSTNKGPDDHETVSVNRDLVEKADPSTSLN